jgi:tetratricopeptide (TPR) repeat protein
MTIYAAYRNPPKVGVNCSQRAPLSKGGNGKPWLILGGILLLGWPVFAKGPSAGAVQAFNKGVKAFNAGAYADAIPYFDDAIERAPEFADAYYARAICRHARKQMDQALSDLNAAIKNNPELVDAYALRGTISYELENWDLALNDFDYVLQQRPKDPQALLGRGILSLKKNELVTAHHDLTLYLKLRPEDPLAPQLRKVLASLSKDTRASESETASDTTSDTPPAKSRHAMSAETQRLTDGLFEQSHEMSDAYGQKVLHGQSGSVVGNIQSDGVNSH